MRLRVTPPTEEDQEEWIARVRASRKLHGEWLAMPDTPVGYAAYLRRSRDPGRRFYVGRRRDDGALVGFANLSEIIRGNLQQAFLGFGAFAGFEGQGYMRELLEQVLRDAFDELGLHRVEANVQPGNERSKALVRRVGFVKEGFSESYLMVAGAWRDHERWAMTEERWRSR